MLILGLNNRCLNSNRKHWPESADIQRATSSLLSGVKLNSFYILQADIRRPMRCGKYVCIWSRIIHISPYRAPCPILLPFFSPLCSFFPFMAAIVPFHHITGCGGTLTRCWLSKSFTWFDMPRGPPSLPLGCKTTIRELILWVHASALCMFMSNIWNKWQSIGWNNTDKSSQFTRKESNTGHWESGPLDGWQEECLHYSINTWKGYILCSIYESIHLSVFAWHTQVHKHILPHKHRDLRLHPGKRLDSPSILPNQIYSESKLKGTFNQPLWVFLSIWEQQQSSLLGVV